MNLQTRPKLETSSYDREACQVGIVHLGFGAFHRAHQAVYVDAYLEQTGDLRWGIAAVNLRKDDSTAFAEAAANDDGYLLKTTSPSADVRYQLIRPHIVFEDWALDIEAAEALVDLETVKVISMTVTESGYFLNADGSLNFDAPAIAAEMAGEVPETIYGYLASALERRMAGTGQPVTILCCDNIRANGKVLEKNFLQYLDARHLDELAEWVRQNVTFPCTMVDRITPRVSASLISEAEDAFPGLALSLIHGESFIQWIIEDNFAGPMPKFGQVGVEIVADVDPYEEAKIRILNGGHTGLCYLGALAGHQTFDEAMRDDRLRLHFDGFENDNVLPGLAIELPFDRRAYLVEIVARFGNRAIADDLARICMDGWSKMQIFIRPTLEGCLTQGISPTFGYDCVASWYVYARRVAAGTMPVPYHEPYWDELKPLLAPGSEEKFAKCPELWSSLPMDHGTFVPNVVDAIKQMEEKWPA